MLSASVGESETLGALVSPLGLLAAALGLIGFGLAYVWRQRIGAEAGLPPTGLSWVDATAAGSRALAGQVASINSGRLGAYVLTSVVGVAVILLLAKTVMP